jgi:hypothetical protein
VAPQGKTIRAIRFLTPERADARELPAQVKEGRARFERPEFLVSSVIRTELGAAR